MRLFIFPLMLLSLWFGSSYRLNLAPAAMKDTYFNCHPSFQGADLAGSEVLVEECTKLGKRIAQIMTGAPWVKTTPSLLRYWDRYWIPNQLLAMDAYAYFLETQDGCQTSRPEKLQCKWVSQLRGELGELLEKMKIRDAHGRDTMGSRTGVASLVSVVSELQQTLSAMDLAMTKFSALESANTSQTLSVSSVLSEKQSTFKRTIERAEELEGEIGCPLTCDALRNMREWAGQILAKGRGLEEALEGVKSVENVKDEL